jgi:hypothetical protein
MSLVELERSLQELSHGDEALKTVQAFAQGLSRNERVQLFNASGALVRFPIHYEAAVAQGVIADTEDEFVLLQGDIIRTDAAYLLGERLVGRSYAIANSTCDLVPGRREYALLLPLHPILRTESSAKAQLGELLSFRSNRRMYLPPLPGDSPDVVGNAIVFDGVVGARMEDAILAERVASLSLVGWRIFGSHLRGVLTRAGESEATLRRAFTKSS